MEASADHGKVVNTLKAEVTRLGFRAANNQHRDLYTIAGRDRVQHIFEVKTDTSTTSLYTGVGQLMLHGAAESRPPRRILVLPGVPKGNTPSVLSRIGIETLTYRWRNQQITFDRLTDLL